MTIAVQEPVRNADGIEAALGVLRQRFGERLVLSDAVREQHGHTTTWLTNQKPDGVFFAESTEEVSEAVKVCSTYKVPIIAFGTGTSLEGHVNAPLGGLCIDMSKMNAVLEVHTEDLDCVIQPGVTRKQLNAYLRDTGLFFPIDPGADASLGGMCATRASGTNAVRYGTMKDNVIALEAVMPNGEIVKTASRAKKTSAGYDLTRLLVGSEGTLGIITEITLRLYGIPETIAGGVCSFPDVGSACNASILTIQSGIPVARIELVDALQIKASNAYSKLDLPVQPALFVEFHGTEQSVREQSDLFGEIAAECGGGKFEWATEAEARTKLWQARHDAYWAALGLKPGTTGVSTDVCVPISRLAECVEETAADIKANDLLAPLVGHVGDGNFHVMVLMDMDDRDEVAKTEAFIERLNWRAIEMEGTCTGEHGIGQGKKKYLGRELGEPSLAMMRMVKSAIDPDNIMNPGKIIP
ncbi:MAG: FAD-linked oxidase C-terminal domain-containing protein [Pseudomonadota bacterium]